MSRKSDTDPQKPAEQAPEQAPEQPAAEPASQDTTVKATPPAPTATFLDPVALADKPTVLVKGDHKVTTTHPAEVVNLKARGYRAEGK